MYNPNTSSAILQSSVFDYVVWFVWLLYWNRDSETNHEQCEGGPITLWALSPTGPHYMNTFSTTTLSGSWQGAVSAVNVSLAQWCSWTRSDHQRSPLTEHRAVVPAPALPPCKNHKGAFPPVWELLECIKKVLGLNPTRGLPVKGLSPYTCGFLWVFQLLHTVQKHA